MNQCIEFTPQKGVRRHTPSFDVPMPNHPIAKRLNAVLSVHNWSKNRFIAKLRREGGELKRRYSNGAFKVKVLPPRRASIRLEREQTLNALVSAMIYRCDYSPDALYLFEVKASTEELAKMIGQLHAYDECYDAQASNQYRHGRLSCDPVHRAMDDLEAAKMIVVVREFDKETKTSKAKRIFLRPEFFQGFGFTMKDTSKMLASAKKWQEKQGLTKTLKEKRQLETLRLAKSDRIASLNRPALKNLLTRLKRQFKEENKHTKEVLDAHHRLKQAEKELVEKKQNQRDDLEKELFTLQMKLPPVAVFKAKNAIHQSHPQATGKQFTALLVEFLKTHL